LARLTSGGFVIPLSALWLPILLSAVAVFFLSSLIHMMSPWHKSDYPPLPNENALADAVRPLDLPPGDYMVPRPIGRDDMKSDAFKEKVNRGPNLILTVIPNGPRGMGKYLVSWFVYLVVVTLFAAYIGACVAMSGEHQASIHAVGITAFVGYTLGMYPMSIWYHRKWSTTLKMTFDGLVYAAATLLIFGALWPR
jgi:hypothetical protein